MQLRAPGELCLFAKRPIAGRVKTRLASSVGSERAAELASAFLEDALLNLRGARRPLVLALDATDDELARHARVVLQGEGDLGQRITRVLRAILAESGYVIVLGADTPGLPRAFVDRAAALLEDPRGPDVVIGPTSDGGFYLLGVRELPGDALDGVRWSTEHACADVEARFGARGMRVGRLPGWFDVDVLADLERLTKTLEADPSLFAPATRRALNLLPQSAGEQESP